MSDGQPLILLLDDDDKFVAEFKDMAAEQLPDYELIRARSLETAIKTTHSRQPELVILSLTLAETTPVQILRGWDLERPINVPYIALVDKALKKTLKSVEQAEALDWLVKDDCLPLLLPHIVPSVIERHALRRQSARMRESIASFSENAGFAVLVADEQENIQRANMQALDLYGYSLEELQTMKLGDLAIDVGERLDANTALWMSRITAGPYTIRSMHRTKSRELRYVESSTFPVHIARNPGLMMTVKDLTDYKQAEDEVRFLQRFNSNLLDNLPICITVKTVDGRITYQNETASSVFGVLVGRTLAEAAEIDTDLQQLADQQVDPEQLPAEHMFDWAGRTWAVYANTLQDIRGDGTLIVEMVADITEQKRTQQDLIDAQRMEAVGNLAGGVAHDFNNLLSGILGYANLIQAVSEENEQIVQYAQVIEETCSRASDLTRQLLQFARSKAQGQERFDAGTIARYAGKLLRHSVKKEIRLKQEFTQKKLPIAGDPAQVQQMIVNLCLNANESMVDGTLTLSSDRIEVPEGHDLVRRGLLPGTYAVITIVDSGRAIDTESTVALLDPYFSNDQSIVPVSLGLSVAQAIVKAHEGIIVASGRAREGVTVRVYLPIASPKPVQTEESSEDADLPVQGTETILIIDDEEVIRNLMLTSLSRYGYRVLVAAGGEEGVNLYSMFKDEIDLVMLDLGLPGMDGRKVFKLIRGINPSAKVVLFTGSHASGRVNQLLEEGAASYITKPISLKRLSRTMRETLDTPVTSDETPEK